MRKTMRYSSAALAFLFLLALLLPGLALGQEGPVLPAAYYGTVVLNGQPAPVGTLIVAKIDGEVRGRITVKEAGKYGGPGPLDPKLIVQGTVADEGKSVVFEVAGIRAVETVTFKPGSPPRGFEEVNLTAAGEVPQDTTPPVIQSFTINNGAPATNSTSVTLGLEAVDDQTPQNELQMRFSNDDGQAWSSWETYTSTKSWELSPGEGQKTVSVQVKDGTGNTAAKQASIMLDQTPPTAPANLQVTAKTSSSVRIAWDASTDNIVVAKYVIEVKQTGGQFQVAGESTTNSFTKTGLAPSTTYVFRIEAVDVAGNESGWSNEVTVTTDASPIGGGGGGGGGGGAVPSPPTPPTPAKVEKPIEPGATTVAEIPGTVKIEVPPGAVSGVGAAIMAEVVGDDKATGAGMPLVSKVVDINLGNGSLTGMLVIIFSFDKGKLGPDQIPVAHYYDEKAGKWARLEGIADLDKGTVAVTVDHLTLFAVFAVPKQPEQPQPPATPTRTFADIQGHWAQKDIEVMAGLGIAGGVAPDKFDPNGLVTRAQFAAFLIRSLGIAETKPAAGSFKDVSPDAWYYGAVETARAAGLVGGYPDGTFRPGQNITREEIAAMVVRALAKGGKPVTVADPEAVLARFADKAAIGPWAREAAAQAVEAGIVAGREGNRFAPKENATRAEAVVMLKRMLVSLGRIPE